MSGTEESKTKRIKITVPLHATTSALKRTAEMAETEERVDNGEGTECNIQNDEGTGSVTFAKELDGEYGEGEGKGEWSKVEKGKVCLSIAKPMAKRRYTKRNMEYWSLKEKVKLTKLESKMRIGKIEDV